MTRCLVWLACAIAAVTPAGLRAHHSFAAFDRTKQVTFTGVVREFQWNNPHAWIQVVVTDANGRQVEWGFECGSPNMMARTGWRRTTLKAGDKVVVVGNPLKDGKPNASLVKITLPDGRVLGPGDAPPPRPLKSDGRLSHEGTKPRSESRMTPRDVVPRPRSNT